MLLKKIFIKLTVAIGFCLIANFAQAYQVNDIEVLQLVRNGVLKDPSKLTQVALEKHKGSKVREGGELKQIYGRYVYRVALLDPKKIKWNVDLDAETGEVISNMID